MHAVLSVGMCHVHVRISTYSVSAQTATDDTSPFITMPRSRTSLSDVFVPDPDGKVKRQAGVDLFELLLGIYASGRAMSAKDFAIACHYCDVGGMQGERWDLWGMPPGRQTGKYKTHIDKYLPGTGPLYTASLPMAVRGSFDQQKATTAFQMVYETLAEEVRNDIEIARILEHGTDDPNSVMCTRMYTQSAIVRDCVDSTGKWPLPIALYADAVRYTPLHAGRTDSVLNVSLVNCVSQKRHYIGFLRSLDKCGCGCNGLCTLYGFFHVVSWMLEAVIAGRAPLSRHDGTPWADPNIGGKALNLKAVLCYVKGDWAEFQHSFGLAPWSSIYHACPCCTAPLDSFNLVYPGFLTRQGLPFMDRPNESYAQCCRTCERGISITTEDERTSLMDLLMFRQSSAKRHGGLVVVRESVAWPSLREGDALVPSVELLDIRDLRSKSLPLNVIFWRSHRDEQGRSIDWLSSRSPVFSELLGTDPGRHLALDILHTVHLGVANRLGSAMIWRVIELNPYGRRSLGLRVKLIESALFRWYDTHSIPAEAQLNRLTLGMIGGGKKVTRLRGDPHPGMSMKIKGAEMMTLLRFALSHLTEHASQIPLARSLIQAGEALLRWCDIAKRMPAMPDVTDYQGLIDECSRVCIYAADAKVRTTPKFHLFCHLTLRTQGA